jgi:ADP-ribose pyrophosphatase YjhB (NUDIX family)
MVWASRLMGNSSHPSPIGKWQVRSSKSLLRDQWIDVRADHCVTPSGAEVSPYYVLSYPEWVNVVAITPDACLVLIRQYRHGVGDFVLELPAGAVDSADPSEDYSAQRELREETGFIAPRWQKICSLYTNPATHSNRIHSFVAYDAIRTGPQMLEASEDGMSVHVMPIAQVLEGLPHGLLGQALQVSALLLGLATAGRLTFQMPPP